MFQYVHPSLAIVDIAINQGGRLEAGHAAPRNLP